MDRFTIDERLSSLPPSTTAKTGDKGFGQRLKKAVEEVNRLQHSADNAREQVMYGSLGIHEGMLALSKADISLRLLLQIRSKVMEAYREISRMPF